MEIVQRSQVSLKTFENWYIFYFVIFQNCSINLKASFLMDFLSVQYLATSEKISVGRKRAICNDYQESG